MPPYIVRSNRARSDRPASATVADDGIRHHCTRHGRRTPHDCSTSTAWSKPPATAYGTPRRSQLGGKPLLCRRQPASRRALDLQPAMARRPARSAGGRTRPARRPGAAAGRRFARCGTHRWRSAEQTSLAWRRSQQVDDGTVHAPLDRRRRPATSAIWERQRELVGGSHGEKTRGHLPSSGGAPRTNWIQKYNCFAIETTGRADEHHRYPRGSCVVRARREVSHPAGTLRRRRPLWRSAN